MFPKRFLINFARKTLQENYSQEGNLHKALYSRAVQQNIKMFMQSTKATYYHRSLDNKLKYFYRSEQSFIDFKKDYYEILGVQQNTEIHIIKQRFYLLAKQYHPDINKGDQTKFKQINEAYNVLSQPNLKQLYDNGREQIMSQNYSPNSQSQSQTQKHKVNLNYNPYSQMTKAQWAVYRSGYVSNDRTDYTNYQKYWTPQSEMNLQYQKQMQWRRAYKSITVQQVKQEDQFRKKLHKKHKEDCQAYHRSKQQYLQKRFSQLGDKLQRFLGQRIRRLYDRLVKK